MRIMPLAASTAGGVAIAVIAYTAYWFVAADEIEDRIAGWAAEQQARGIIVQSGAPQVSGYPLHFEVSLERPSVDNSVDGWAWRGEALTARFRPWRFDKFDLKINGENNVRYFDGATWHDFEGHIEDGSARLQLDDEHRIEKLLLDFKRVNFTGPWGKDPARVMRMRARAERAPDSDQSETASTAAEFASAALDLEGVILPPGYGEELGENIEYLNFDISLFGTLPAGDADAALRAWRDQGGTLELNSFRVRWGPLGIESTGTIALDGEMRPIGALTADIIGYGDIIDALIMSNMIPLGDAFLAKVAFNMLADKPEDGGPPVLRSVPITAQNGGVFVGPVSVGSVSPIRFH
jgi:hypothetical protein